MTLSPERIGDKGQRFQVKYSDGHDSEDEHCLGYATTHEGAQQMADAWRNHPADYFVWVVDRKFPVINECAPEGGR